MKRGFDVTKIKSQGNANSSHLKYPL